MRRAWIAAVALQAGGCGWAVLWQDKDGDADADTASTTVGEGRPSHPGVTTPVDSPTDPEETGETGVGDCPGFPVALSLEDPDRDEFDVHGLATGEVAAWFGPAGGVSSNIQATVAGTSGPVLYTTRVVDAETRELLSDDEFAAIGEPKACLVSFELYLYYNGWNSQGFCDEVVGRVVEVQVEAVLMKDPDSPVAEASFVGEITGLYQAWEHPIADMCAAKD